MYSAMDVARYIIAYEKTQGRPVSNLRLQKLLYFVQANFILSTGGPCFLTRMEAWNFGPVVPQVYQEYRIYGGTTIPVSPSTASLGAIDSKDKAPINSMLDKCGRISTTDLVTISHGQDPWMDAYHNPRSNEITVDAIERYFRS